MDIFKILPSIGTSNDIFNYSYIVLVIISNYNIYKISKISQYLFSTIGYFVSYSSKIILLELEFRITVLQCK